MSKKENTSMIQIYNSIIRNPQLSCLGFTLYAQLIYLFKNDTIYIGKDKLKQYLYIKDKRTLKKALNELYQLKLIKEEYNELPKHHLLQLTPLVIVEKETSFFTQLPASLLTQKLPLIHHEGFRLLYYYESYINRNSDFLYAKTSIQTISKNTGISKNTCDKYNKILEKYKLLKVERHHLNSFYDEDDIVDWVKFNNYYYVLLDNISSSVKNYQLKTKKNAKRFSKNLVIDSIDNSIDI